jgi:hypothetical protein
MLKKIKQLLPSNRNGKQTLVKSRYFTFMLSQKGIGKSIKIPAKDQNDAEAQLKEMYPDHQVQFLWEWK